MHEEQAVEILPLTSERLVDQAELFETNNTTTGCWCMWFRIPRRDLHAGWGAANRARFQELAALEDPPAGLLAYRDGQPVGWCAVGPRSRYPVAVSSRSRILKGRDPDEDDNVWLVSCFFVRVGARRTGTTGDLLTGAVELAQQYGAKAIEGFPLAGDGPHKSTDRFLGSEPLFAACGFTCNARPTPSRAVMRRELG